MGRVVDLSTVLAEAALTRGRGGRVVLANGAFDLLHVGHVRYLEDARRHGDLMVVAVNSDASVRKAKGPRRPLIPEDERAELVAALRCVDFVTVFNDDTVIPIIQQLRPEVHAKGTDYTPDTVPEREHVVACGGRVVIAGDAKAHSTSGLLGRLEKR